MPIATGLAIGLGAMSAAGAIGGAAIASHGAGKAAQTQADAANHAADLQKQEADASLAFQKQEFNTNQQNIAPWLTAGKGALGELSGLTKTPGQGLLSPFVAPTGVTEQNDPGYQFRLQQGQKMLENSAAARGGLLSGNTAQAELQFGQDYGSNEYQNVYNRAFNTFETNQQNTYNRLAGLAGTGQQAANSLGALGQQAANNVSNINLTSGAQIGNDINNAGAARASGYVGGANAWSGALSGGTNSIMQSILLSQLYGNGAGAVPTTGGV